MPLVDGLNTFAFVPMGTNTLRYNQCLERKPKNHWNGLIAFQCIPMGNGALSYDQLELPSPSRNELSSQLKAPQSRMDISK